MGKYRLTKVLVVFSFLIGTVTSVFAEDWPTYQKDANRSCITSESLKMPLTLNWQFSLAAVPKPAWAAPAKTDFWHREANLKPRVVYDKAFHIIGVGDKVYFGSSADDKIYCLDANTGAEKWSFFTGGPVRLAPTYSNGLLYTGSDDGVVYCLNAETGELVWKINTAEGERFIPGNERMISISPIRTGILVDKGVAYFCSGMFPNEGVELYAVDAANGKILWQKSDMQISPQGYLLLSDKNIYIPTGRTTPFIFSRKDGEYMGRFEGNGGTYALLLNDELIFGGGDEGELNCNIANKDEDDQIASFLGLQIIVKGDTSYLRSYGELSAISRKKYIKGYKDWSNVEEEKSDYSDKLWDLREQRKFAITGEEIKKLDIEIAKLINKINKFDDKREEIEAGGLIWKDKIEGSYSMILAGNSLIVGSDGKVEIFNSETGEKLWNQKVEGVAYSLAVAGKKLLVSTDKGKIYSFTGSDFTNQRIQKQRIVENPYKSAPGNELIKNAVKKIKESGIDKGYCLVVGSETGHLMYELAKQTNLKIVGVEDDPAKVEKSRRLLNSAGIYGERVSVINGSLKNLPLSKYFANIITSERMLLNGEIPTSADEIYRVIKPFGGIAILGGNSEKQSELENWAANSENRWTVENSWAQLTRGAIEGAGEWTHLYSNPGNTSCSNDPVQKPLQIQWFGRPGPREMINRHSRPMSTLFKNGRLFVPGDNRVICVDAYNGTPLWKKYIPDSRVLGALKDCGTMAVADDYIYVAAGQTALGFNVETGKQEVVLEAPQLVDGQDSKWGYVALVDDQIFGSGKKPSASFTVVGRINCDQFENDFREMVMSDYLFSLDRHTGKELWSYNGVVFNNTITIGDGFIYFIESRNNKAVMDFDGKLRVDYFCEEPTFIVKLNMKTGKKEWEKEFEFPFEQIMYLAYSDGVLLTTGSFNKGNYVNYSLFAFDGKSGDKLWEQTFRAGNSRWDNRSDDPTIDGAHGEQWQHPVIIAGKVVLPPYDFDLHTGIQGDLYLTRGGGGCGGISGSASNIFARGSNPKIYDIMGEESGEAMSRVNRPGCWINIIPAGNVISIPEASSGCTCNYPIQTSIVFVSKN